MRRRRYLDRQSSLGCMACDADCKKAYFKDRLDVDVDDEVHSWK